MKALLTGFEPFRCWAVNSSGAVALALAAARPGLSVAVLPVDHVAAPLALSATIAEARPDVLLLCGLADEPRMRLERIGRRPEHRGDGPGVLHGVWPWAAALDAMRATGAPVRLSSDAGRYVCDTTYWSALAAPGRPSAVAFLHVPPIGPDWPLGRIVAAAGACLEAGGGIAR